MNTYEIEKNFDSQILKTQPLTGGSISTTTFVEFNSGQKLVVKEQLDNPDLLFKEASGLKEIEKFQKIKTPKVLYLTEGLLCIEYVVKETPQIYFWSNFGKQLAQLHKIPHKYIGFSDDNYIGRIPQINIAPNNNCWVEFFRKYRIQYQLQIAAKKKLVDTEFLVLSKKLLEKIYIILDPIKSDSMSLLHGDLWSGNFICSKDQSPYLIDPAVYYGHREAELAMPYLFGGFDSVFFKEYNQCFPLRSGWETRVELYKLYHVLNHLNHFGSSYLNQARSIITNLLKV